MEDLLARFSEHENFRMSLENLLCSPPPNYSDQQWDMVEALLELLPLLAAQLKITFNERGIYRSCRDFYGSITSSGGK